MSNEVDRKTAFEEAGRYHRFILGWRQAAFVGYIGANFAVATYALSWFDKSKFVVAAVLIAFSPLGYILRRIDARTRQLYHAAQKSAEALQDGESAKESEKYSNLYRALMNSDKEPKGTPAEHTVALNSLYTTCSDAAILGGAFFGIWGVIELLSSVHCT